MKDKNLKHWPGTGLIFAGSIVFIVGLTVVLFKEFEIPKHWVPVAVGGILIAAGIIMRKISMR